MNNAQIQIGDWSLLKNIPDNTFDCCVTSPPYFGLRDYGVEGQIGLEKTVGEYVSKLVEVFSEVRRTLKDAGTLWLNLGDSYNAAGRQGHGTRVGYKQGTNRASANKSDWVRPTDKNLKPKDLLGIPWAVAFALRDSGWYLRQDIIWHKVNPMPESVKDRCTKAHEYIFLLTKGENYFYDSISIREPSKNAGLIVKLGKKSFSKGQAAGLGISPSGNGTKEQYQVPAFRNKRSVWTVSSKPYKGAHFATFPPDLILPCILAGCPENGTVLDPFAGSGTVGMVALQNKRNAFLIELNPEYKHLIEERCREPKNSKNPQQVCQKDEPEPQNDKTGV